jgi:hypothetical protein
MIYYYDKVTIRVHIGIDTFDSTRFHDELYEKARYRSVVFANKNGKFEANSVDMQWTYKTSGAFSI